MITTNDKWKYKVNYVSFPKDKYTSCSVGVKNKETGNYVNYRLFSFKKIEGLQDGDEVRITHIHSTEETEYNGKNGPVKQLQVTVDMEIVGKTMNNDVDTGYEDNRDESVPEITSDDLPF